MLLSAAYLTSFLLVLASALDTSARTTFVDGQAPMEIILAQEAALAKSYFAKHPEGQVASQKPAEKELTQQNNKAPELPVESFATREDFLKMADIQFDKSKQHWSATWEKPKMFNFGMLLKPALVENMEPGTTYSFISHGKLTTITRALNDELVLKRGNEQITLSASELRNLLSDRISVSGLNVFLDRRGNLVMEARGPKALSMPTVTKM